MGGWLGAVVEFSTVIKRAGILCMPESFTTFALCKTGTRFEYFTRQNVPLPFQAILYGFVRCILYHKADYERPSIVFRCFELAYRSDVIGCLHG